MAALARLIRETIEKAFEDEDRGDTLHQQFEGFRRVLLHDLSPEQFADMYAQTIAYGLFAARVNAPPGQRFTREHAAYELPKTNPFLRKMFGYVAGPELDGRIEWAVDDLAELLHRADMAAILRDFGHRTRQEDPVVHFYETFLAAYDPRMREARGVYYTPEPVVSYIVRSVDHLLKTEFGLPDGLADTGKVKIPNPDPKAKCKTWRCTGYRSSIRLRERERSSTG
jgi:predicted helicase